MPPSPPAPCIDALVDHVEFHAVKTNIGIGTNRAVITSLKMVRHAPEKGVHLVDLVAKRQYALGYFRALDNKYYKIRKQNERKPSPPPPPCFTKHMRKQSVVLFLNTVCTSFNNTQALAYISKSRSYLYVSCKRL